MGSRESGLVCFGPITGGPCSLSLGGSSEQDWSKGGEGAVTRGLHKCITGAAGRNVDWRCGITQPKLKSLWHTAHTEVGS